MIINLVFKIFKTKIVKIHKVKTNYQIFQIIIIMIKTQYNNKINMNKFKLNNNNNSYKKQVKKYKSKIVLKIVIVLNHGKLKKKINNLWNKNQIFMYKIIKIIDIIIIINI